MFSLSTDGNGIGYQTEHGFTSIIIKGGSGETFASWDNSEPARISLKSIGTMVVLPSQIEDKMADLVTVLNTA